MFPIKNTGFSDSSRLDATPAFGTDSTDPRRAQQKDASTGGLLSAVSRKIRAFKSHIASAPPRVPNVMEMSTINVHDTTTRHYAEKLTHTFVLLQHGDVVTTLRTFDLALPPADATLHRPLQNSTDVKEANRTVGVRARSAQRAVDAQTDLGLQTLAHVVLDTSTARLSDLMATAARHLLPGGSHAHLGAASLGSSTLFNHHANLELLRTTIAYELKARNLPLPAQTLPDKTDGELLGTIGQGTGITLAIDPQTHDMHVIALPAEFALTAAFSKQLADVSQQFRSAHPDPRHTPLWTPVTLKDKNGDDVTLMIAESMRQGTGRNTYTYQPPGTDKTLTLSMPSCYSHPDQDRQNLQFVFDNITQSNPQVMRWLSYFGSKNTYQLFLDTLAHNPDLNPVRLPSGSSAQIGPSCDAVLTCHMAPDHDGSVTLHIRADLRNATTLLPTKHLYNDLPPGTTKFLYKLDPDLSYQTMTITIRLDPDGDISQIKPIIHGFGVHIIQTYIDNKH